MREANSLATMVKSQGGKGSELVNLPFEGHQKKSPGLGVNRNVEENILQINAVCPHFWKKSSSDRFC